jgi:hypothetical protein
MNPSHPAPTGTRRAMTSANVGPSQRSGVGAYVLEGMAAAAFSAERDRGGSCVPQTVRAPGVTAGMDDIQIVARRRRCFRPSGIVNVVVGQ